MIGALFLPALTTTIAASTGAALASRRGFEEMFYSERRASKQRRKPWNNPKGKPQHDHHVRFFRSHLSWTEAELIRDLEAQCLAKFGYIP